MEEKKSIFQNKKLIVLPVLLVVIAVIGITYAFFSYIRTGPTNAVAVGRVAFNTTQTSGEGGYINLSNAFPVDVSSGIPNDTDNVGEVTINVTGDTTYEQGVEYLVKAVGVTNTTSGASPKTVPISISVTVENNGLTTLGTASNDYYTVRGGSTSYYKVLAGNTISNNQNLVVGYIAPGATGVDGNIVIKAYFDASKILISDTYPTEETDTNNDGYLDGTPASAATGKTVYTTTEWNSLRTNGVSFQVNIVAQEGVWTQSPGSATLSLSPVSGTVAPNKTTTSTISTNGNGVLSCTPTDSSVATCSITGSTLTITGVSEGSTTITVNEAAGSLYATASSTTYTVTVAIPTIASCEGCEYVLPNSTSTKYYYSASNSDSQPLSTRTTFANNSDTLYADYTELVATKNKNYFLGFKFDGSGNITNAYACGIKGTDMVNNEEQVPGVNAGTAFCIEGSTDGSSYSANSTLLSDSTTGIWQGRCGVAGSRVRCNGSVNVIAYSNGRVDVGVGVGGPGGNGCSASNSGGAFCY